MDIAGLVKVKVQADLSELERGFAEGQAKAKAFDREAARSFTGIGRSATVAGSAVRAANDNIAGSATRAALAYENLNRAATLASRAMGALVGAAIGSALIQFADTWSDLNARIGLAVGNMDASAAVMSRLSDVARRTYSALELTAESFIANAGTLKELGKSTKEQLDYTEALNLALVVSGAKAERAASVQDALAKAMALGKLSGDNLNTVIQTGGRVAEVLAEQLGVGVNQLRGLGAQGKITGEVIYNALTKRLEQLREEAEAMPATIGDGFMLIRNALLETIGVFDQAGQLSATFANALVFVADNMDRIITYGATAVTMYGTYYVAAFVAANAATVTLSGALTVLRGALIRTGIGALVVAAGELVYQFTRLVEATGSLSGAMQEFGRRAQILLEAITYGFEAAGQAIKAVWYGAMADILGATEDAFGGILRILGVSADAMAEKIAAYKKIAENAGEFAKTSAGIASDQFGYAFGEIKIPEAKIPAGGGAAVKALGEVDKAEQKAAKAYKKIVEGAKEFIASQEAERKTIGLTEEEANKLRYTQDLMNKASQAGIKLTAGQKKELEGLAAQMAAAKQATDGAKMAQDAYNDAANSAGGWFRNLLDGTKKWKDALIDVIPTVLKLMNTLNIAQGGKGLFGGGMLQSFLGGFLGFADGGYTGAGPATQAAGVVHGGEYVFSKRATDRIGVGALDQLHKRAKGYAEGGYVAPVMTPQPANGNQPQQIELNVSFSNNVDKSGNITSFVQQVSTQTAGAVVKQARPILARDAVSSVQSASRMRPGLFR